MLTGGGNKESATTTSSSSTMMKKKNGLIKSGKNSKDSTIAKIAKEVVSNTMNTVQVGKGKWKKIFKSVCANQMMTIFFPFF